MKDHLDLKAYAKINLGLDVVRKREDGYHEVRMIMQTVNLYDRIEMDRTEDGVIRTETNLPFRTERETLRGARRSCFSMKRGSRTA